MTLRRVSSYNDGRNVNCLANERGRERDIMCVRIHTGTTTSIQNVCLRSRLERITVHSIIFKHMTGQAHSRIYVHKLFTRV